MHIDTIRAALRGVFPDPQADITEDNIQHIARSLVTSSAPEARQLGEALGIPAEMAGWPAPVAPAPDGHTYLMAMATHTRHTPSGAHQFTGELPCVRVQLPEDGEPVIHTAIGTVYAGDHKLYNRKVAQAHMDDACRDFLGIKPFKVARIDAITPARGMGRFGAIAVYVVYSDRPALKGRKTVRTEDGVAMERVPVCYILEAGMATGEARVLYTAPDFGQIIRRSWYQPTPWSKATHYYKGHLRLRPDGEQVAALNVEVHETNKANSKPYMQVDVLYQPLGEADICEPALLTFQAACRVAAIATARRELVPGMGSLTPLFGAIGLTYSWSQKPVQLALPPPPPELAPETKPEEPAAPEQE
jgi:hypothetical protein